MTIYINYLVEKMKKSEFFKSITILVSGNVIAQLITLITVPIVSRIYSQEAYGEFSIMISTAAIVGSFASLGLTSAIMIPKEESKAQAVVSTAFVTQFVISTVFFIVSIMLIPYVHFFTTKVSYPIACILLYIYLILTNMAAILSTYVNRQKKYKVLFWNSLIGSLATLLITLPLGILGWGSTGFIIAAICSAIISNTQMVIRSNPFKRLILVKEMVAIYKEFKEFIIYQFPANLIANLVIQLPNQTFSASFGNIALGGYAMCQRLLGYPLNIIGAPIGTVYFRTASQYFREGKNIGEFTFSLIRRVMMVAFIPLVLLMSFGDKLFMFVLGSKWEEAGLFASVLALQYVLMFCNLCIAYNLVAINRQKTNLVISGVQFIMVGVSIFIGLFFFKNMYSTLICFAIGNTAFQTLKISINLYYLNKTFFIKFIFFAILYIAMSCIVGIGLRMV